MPGTPANTRPVKVATPFTAVTVVVPLRVPPMPLAMLTVTRVELSLVAGLPKRSRIINLGTVVSAGSSGSVEPDSPPTAESSTINSAGTACVSTSADDAAEVIEVAPMSAVMAIV